MPKAWVRIPYGNPEALGLEPLKDHIKGCEEKARCDPRQTETHADRDGVCIGVAPLDKGPAFLACVKTKYPGAHASRECAEKYEREASEQSEAAP